MQEIKEFNKFTRFLFYEHDLSQTKLTLSKSLVAVLMIMDEHRDKSMSQMSKEIGLEKSSFTRAAEQLVRDGFVKRVASKEDRRVAYVELTAKGERAVTLIKTEWEKYFSELTSHLTNKELAEFHSAVKTVSRYMNKIMSNYP